MSQRTIKTKSLNVMSGWDRPTQRYFLVIHDSKENILFSNLRLNDADSLGVLEIEMILNGFGIFPCDEFWADLQQDGWNDVGNLSQEYTCTEINF